MLERFKKSVLHGVSRVLCVSQNSGQRPVDSTAVAFNKLLKGIGVPISDSLYDLPIGIDRDAFIRGTGLL
jgi:hypothetical protein